MAKSVDGVERKIVKIPLGNINPYIRRASKHTIEGGLFSGVRINPHYQLHYICKGIGGFVIDGIKYRASKGDFLMWGPGQLHSIESDIHDPLQVIGIQFDLTMNYACVEYPCIHYNEETFSWNKVNELIEFMDSPRIPSYSHIKDRSRIKYYLEEVHRLFDLNSPYCKEIMSGLLKSVLLLVLEENLNILVYEIDSKPSIETVIEYLREHSDEKMTNTFLGQEFNYHPNHLNKLLLNNTGQTIQQYLITLRLNKAIDLLQHSNYTIGEIAELVGGYSIHYFSRLFKKKMGVSPQAFRG